MIKVINELDVVELNGIEVPPGSEGKITVLSHWLRDQLVVLEIEGKRYTLKARDLQAAITNATNTVKF